MDKKIFISQSNYIPWKGYFDSIRSADIFVVYDDMQYTRQDWRNRNLIKTPQGPKWLSIPVEMKGRIQKKIKDVKVADAGWARSHWDTLRNAYRHAPCFRETAAWAEALYGDCTTPWLSEINLHFIRAINAYLQIGTDIRDSGDFVLSEDKTGRLVDICSELGGTTYLSGPSAKDYLDEAQFWERNIRVSYFDYTGYPEYEQVYPPFTHGVSVLDLIFHTGSRAGEYLNKMAP